METKHTPGPWEAEQLYAKGNDGKFVVISKTNYICVCDAIEGVEVNEPNADLISAAPDLLEACQEMVEAFDRHHPEDGIIAIREAIAKATGD